MGGVESSSSSSSAIRPDDLASPEYSYLSKVYGNGSGSSKQPLSGQTNVDGGSLGEQGIHRKKLSMGPSSIDDTQYVGNAPSVPPRGGTSGCASAGS